MEIKFYNILSNKGYSDYISDVSEYLKTANLSDTVQPEDTIKYNVVLSEYSKDSLGSVIMFIYDINNTRFIGAAMSGTGISSKIILQKIALLPDSLDDKSLSEMFGECDNNINETLQEYFLSDDLDSKDPLFIITVNSKSYVIKS